MKLSDELLKALTNVVYAKGNFSSRDLFKSDFDVIFKEAFFNPSVDVRTCLTAIVCRPDLNQRLSDSTMTAIFKLMRDSASTPTPTPASASADSNSSYFSKTFNHITVLLSDDEWARYETALRTNFRSALELIHQRATRRYDHSQLLRFIEGDIAMRSGQISIGVRDYYNGKNLFFSADANTWKAVHKHLCNGKPIDAIHVLHQGNGLKTAKDFIDAYVIARQCTT